MGLLLMRSEVKCREETVSESEEKKDEMDENNNPTSQAIYTRQSFLPRALSLTATCPANLIIFFIAKGN
ncbi:hypothetical protein RJT34_13070 [Clitoria ternatea]|uniref:Uncharacterized protein n=1 Tax=Clitoria ternatea TaxID=43366 RepID=A0AAN9JQI4_CLITE